MNHSFVQKADTAALFHQLLNKLEGADTGDGGKSLFLPSLLCQGIQKDPACARPLLAENQTLRKQLLNGHFTIGKGVIICADAHKRFTAQQEAFVAAFVEDPFQNHEIQCAVIQQLQQMSGIVHKESERISGLLQISADFREKNIVTYGFCRTDTKLQTWFCPEGSPQSLLIIAQRNCILFQKLSLKRL